MRMLSTLAFLIASTVATLAHENCYELIGCPHRDVFSRSDLRQLSCQNLWYVRKRDYDDHCYCFTTPTIRIATSKMPTASTSMGESGRTSRAFGKSSARRVAAEAPACAMSAQP